MMVSKADILPEKEFVIIANAASDGQGWCSFRAKIGAIARGETQIPRLVGPKSNAAAESWVVKAYLSRIPGLRPGSERRILDFQGITKFSYFACDRSARRVAWPPDDRIVHVLVEGELVDELTHSPRRVDIRNRCQVFVGQRRRDEWIFP